MLEEIACAVTKKILKYSPCWLMVSQRPFQGPQDFIHEAGRFPTGRQPPFSECRASLMPNSLKLQGKFEWQK